MKKNSPPRRGDQEAEKVAAIAFGGDLISEGEMERVGRKIVSFSGGAERNAGVRDDALVHLRVEPAG